LGQFIGTLVALVVGFALCFAILTLGSIMPDALIPSSIVADFLSSPDLELRLVITGTVMYPSAFGSASLGAMLSTGARSATVLMFLAWGTGGLIGGLLARGPVQGIFAGVFSVVLGAFLIWLLVFFVQTPDFGAIFGTASLLILEAVFEGSVYPFIGVGVGGLLGGAISRER
jgi:hypothetical protein